MSLFVTQTQNVLNLIKEEIFQFKKQMKFLDNLIYFIESPSRNMVLIAFTNLKSLLFYSPPFRIISNLNKFKEFLNPKKIEIYNKFWTNLYNEQFENMEKREIITHRKKNVKKYVRCLAYVLLFFINMKIAHRRKIRGIEKSNISSGSENLNDDDLHRDKNKFKKKKGKIVESVSEELINRLKILMFLIKLLIRKIKDTEILLIKLQIKREKRKSLSLLIFKKEESVIEITESLYMIMVMQLLSCLFSFQK